MIEKSLPEPGQGDRHITYGGDAQQLYIFCPPHGTVDEVSSLGINREPNSPLEQRLEVGEARQRRLCTVQADPANVQANDVPPLLLGVGHDWERIAHALHRI